ncbi:uncharacterized protein LOC122510555 [Leptopilina heterotoma]|uniref:uncharacterized protein LOC122510555 n=1 Tax=Leptopilina heterotoma TaxID=63436 RepID=UPI001CA8C762|nr:uncharacterized protein LOC122510555 [Leptopilina heterotoma]
MCTAETILGRKKRKSVDSWKRNVAKKLRNEGNEYISLLTGESVPAKTFITPTSCCSRKCFLKIESRYQEKLFIQFWKLGDYKVQNILLSSFIKEKKLICFKATM